jgi:hypothetical protein
MPGNIYNLPKNLLIHSQQQGFKPGTVHGRAYRQTKAKIRAVPTNSDKGPSNYI